MADVAEVWELSGLNSWQRGVVEDAVFDCTFPWVLLLPEVETIRGEPFISVKSSDLSRFRGGGEQHVYVANGAVGHPVTVRRQVLGLFWTDGRIEIEQSITDPVLVQEIFLAEAAHSVDYFLPMTDEMKLEIERLLHGGALDGHTWWEERDYSAEYFTLIGEAWMALFTLAYSDVTPWQDGFEHRAARDMVPHVYEILGVWPSSDDPKPEPEPPPSDPSPGPLPGFSLWDIIRDWLRWLFNRWLGRG